MSVRLIAATLPVDPEFGANAGEFVAYVARVSNPAGQHRHETGAKLLARLRRDGHWSPYEMANAVLEIVTTRDIARQILRHRSFAFQEFSQRYAEVTEFAPPREARLQDAANRQNSIETGDMDLHGWWEMEQERLTRHADAIYRAALGKGVAKEVARAVLPEGLTVSRLYMNGSLRSWTHYLAQRLDPSTQKEHRRIALECQRVLAGAFPDVFEAPEPKP